MRAPIAERVKLAAQAAIEAEASRLNAGPALRQLCIKISLHPNKDKAYIDYQGSEVEV
ncbi:MAG: hypothetical protein NUW01_00020 [Gemmatimonadaceae bacterium]|nr:hypothetical protein [Gemmatimonadaceae bacterium]